MTKKISHLKEEKIKRLVEKMEPALQPVLERAQAALNRSVEGYAQGRYLVGVEIKEVMKDPDKYGQEAVKQLSKALGRAEASLYDYAKVVETWPDKRTFNALFNRKNVHGVSLSFSHLVALANVKSAKRREALIQEALTEGYSVRELTERIKTASGPAESSGADARTNLPKEVERSLKRLRVSTNHWRVLAESFQSSPSTPESLEELRRVVSEGSSLRADLEKSFGLLHQELVRRGGGQLPGEEAADQEQVAGSTPPANQAEVDAQAVA